MVMYCLSSTLAFPLESTDRRGPTVVAVLLGFGGGNTTAAGIILEEENPKFIRVDSKDIPEFLQKTMIIFFMPNQVRVIKVKVWQPNF